jgi:hypothetical protein
VATYAHRTTSIGRVLVGLAVLWGIVGLSGGGSWAGDSEHTRATLRGVEGVYVIVEDLKSDVERAGLTRQQLQTDVELQLRKAGIRVFAKQEQFRSPGQPLLYVNASALLHPNGLAAYNIRVELNQRASLDINTSSASVATWHVGMLGMIGVSRVSDTVRNDVRDLVDQFINAYLSVNPRPAPSVTSPTSAEKAPTRQYHSYFDLGRPSTPTPPEESAPEATPLPQLARPASPRRDLVRQVQERLQTVGFNPGTIDGSMGPQTQQALRWFQNAKGLVANGDLDERTLDALGVR